MSGAPRVPPVPAVLRLVQTMALGRWRERGEQLYREVAALVESAPGREVLVSGCGEGSTVEWLAAKTGAAVTGVDPDAESIERAEERMRALVRPVSASFAQSALEDLPHETGVFDAAVGEPTLASAADPARAVAELARVTKPLGPVVLLQLTWSSELSESAREMLVERLAMRPHLLMEWKQMMRDAGLVEIQVQDWTDAGASPMPKRRGGKDGEAPMLTLPQKLQIAGRAWRRWGWKAARGAVGREQALIEELGRERAFGFHVIKGVKWPHQRSDG